MIVKTCFFGSLGSGEEVAVVVSIDSVDAEEEDVMDLAEGDVIDSAKEVNICIYS
jgi:hypothetical protein